jgi:hypothetical protein
MNWTDASLPPHLLTGASTTWNRGGQSELSESQLHGFLSSTFSSRKDLACGPRLELGKSGNTSKWMTTMIMMMMMMKSSSSPRFTTTTTPHNITPSPVLKAWHTAPKEKKQKTEPEEAKTKKRSTKQVREQKKLRKKRKIKREGGETKQDERETERREEVTRDEQSDAREDTITNPWSKHKRGNMALFSLSSLLFST